MQAFSSAHQESTLEETSGYNTVWCTHHLFVMEINLRAIKQKDLLAGAGSESKEGAI